MLGEDQAAAVVSAAAGLIAGVLGILGYAQYGTVVASIGGLVGLFLKATWPVIFPAKAPTATQPSTTTE